MPRYPGLVLVATATSVLIADQATKAVVRASLPIGRSIPLVDGVFQLTHVQNAGAAFGLMPGFRPVFIGITVVVLASIALFWARTKPHDWVVSIALGLIMGGAIGNLIDRVSPRGVTDFLDFNLITFPVFNIADSAILIGVAILSIWLLFGEGARSDDDQVDEPLDHREGEAQS